MKHKANQSKVIVLAGGRYGLHDGEIQVINTLCQEGYNVILFIQDVKDLAAEIRKHASDEVVATIITSGIRWEGEIYESIPWDLLPNTIVTTMNIGLASRWKVIPSIALDYRPPFAENLKACLSVLREKRISFPAIAVELLRASFGLIRKDLIVDQATSGTTLPVEPRILGSFSSNAGNKTHNDKEIRELDINRIIRDLAAKRPIFHSEADFQHSLARIIHELNPECDIRLEVPVPKISPNAKIDLLIRHGQLSIGIELKYKTARFELQLKNEFFSLRNQSAQDINRYHFLMDIQRIEQLVLHKTIQLGYAIFITNESLYWKNAIKQNSIDEAFKINEGRSINGNLAWADHASEGTVAGIQNALSISGNYKCNWQTYANVDGGKNGLFKYLCFQVEP